ncbi:MAG TPA: RecQ family ATP-dependent DNA helicase [Polyangiales bacterium]|nr:RecQ family ATP-dependent DNA helicase [Polyangiales bacterium]
MSSTADRDEAEAHLRRLAGDSARLRDDQWTAIAALVNERRRALVVQRTGWGKSAVYFVATLLLRARGAGPTVIVSPLLALMRNQIAAAERAGVRALTVNSSNMQEWREVYADVQRGAVDALLVSPERLNNPGFRDEVLPLLATSTGLLVVDEAHCISDWGHDFRPDYRRIRSLLAELADGVPVLATTATANARVVEDVAEQLGEGTLVLRGTLDRESLQLAVLELPSPTHRLAWLADHLPELPGSGIVYTLTVAAADEVAAFLRERGISAVAYSGRLEDAERRAAEEDLLANRIKALVATSALGMGFDKPDLGFVVHLGAPPSPIAYYQQIGRAGRGVESAQVVLLPGAEDEAIWRYFGSLAFPHEDQVRRTLAALAAASGPLSVAALETQVDLRRTRLETMLKVLDVDGVVKRVAGGWIATGADWSYDAQRYDRVAAARRSEQQAIRDYAATSGCRMQFLRQQLDDPEATACGRCDRCTGLTLSAATSEASLAAAHAMLAKPGVELPTKKLWPTGMATLDVPLSGKLRTPPAAGRALCRLSDIGWGPRVRELLAASDGDVPQDLFQAVVRVLAEWDWQTRPGQVAWIPSRKHPRLVTSLGERLAQVGRMQCVGALKRVREVPSGAGRSNSAQRLRAIYNTLSAEGLQLQAAPLLLVDVRSDTGWTFCEAARVLSAAGSGPVLPFALALDA